jgi:hypothetical protein
MVAIQDIILFFNVILIILIISLSFGIIAILPFVIFKLSDNIEFYLNRRKFVIDLTRSLQGELVENIQHAESIFLINFPREGKTEEYPFILNNVLNYYLGLINSKYVDFTGNINFRQTPPDEIRHWRAIIEQIKDQNKERLYYADLPLEDRTGFKEILDYFRDAQGIENQHQIFIRTRLMEIKRIVLKKNREMRKTELINYGAFGVSLLGIILTIVFGFKIIGG